MRANVRPAPTGRWQGPAGEPLPPPPAAGVSYRGAVSLVGGGFSPFASLSCATKLGARKAQEDRCLVIPKVHGREDVTFLGVFDGTVGDHAAQFVNTIIGDTLCGTQPFRDVLASDPEGHLRPNKTFRSMEAAIMQGYRATDEALLTFADENRYDYASCTSVTACLAGSLLSIAHLGDSKAVLGSATGPGGALVGRYLTVDHKPDIPAERHRIESSGGLLVYLHGSKPFLRGGDFAERQSRGERSMQLNYSRAFGGLFLKPFGLSATPDITQVELTAKDKILILASDGLWDVATAEAAVAIAWDASIQGDDPALVLADWALQQHAARGSADNVTIIVAILSPPASPGAGAAAGATRGGVSPRSSSGAGGN